MADGAHIIVRQLVAVVGLEVAADLADEALLLFVDDGGHILEGVRAVLAQGAGEVLGQLVALVEIAAHRAQPALGLIGGGSLFGLYVGVIVGVGAAGAAGEHLGLHHVGDKEHLGVQIVALYDLAGQHRVGVLRHIADAV